MLTRQTSETSKNCVTVIIYGIEMWNNNLKAGLISFINVNVNRLDANIYV